MRGLSYSCSSFCHFTQLLDSLIWESIQHQIFQSRNAIEHISYTYFYFSHARYCWCDAIIKNERLPVYISHLIVVIRIFSVSVFNVQMLLLFSTIQAVSVCVLWLRLDFVTVWSMNSCDCSNGIVELVGILCLNGIWELKVSWDFVKTKTNTLHSIKCPRCLSWLYKSSVIPISFLPQNGAQYFLFVKR